jgi:hypothetical protein
MPLHIKYAIQYLQLKKTQIALFSLNSNCLILFKSTARLPLLSDLDLPPPPHTAFGIRENICRGTHNILIYG